MGEFDNVLLPNRVVDASPRKDAARSSDSKSKSMNDESSCTAVGFSDILGMEFIPV